jgi:Transposase DDE domain
METTTFLNETDWAFVQTLLPEGWEESASEHLAIQRKRRLKSAGDLLRIVLLYCFCGLSLSGIGLWWAEAGLGKLSKRAVEMRIQKSLNWIQALLCQKLTERTQGLKPGISDFRIRLVDATVVNRPNSPNSIDWRIHTGFDLVESKIDALEITTNQKGESFSNYSVQAGDLMVGDRGYAHREGIESVVSRGGHVLVRLPWNNVPFETLEGHPFDLLEALRSLQPGQAGDFTVQTAPDCKRNIPAIAGRLVALAKTPEQTEKNRRELHKQAKKKGKTPDKRTVEAAGYIFVFTTVPAEQLATSQVLELYRLRWQIELAFKRLKSTLNLDEIPVKDDTLCKTFLAAKLLGALLVDELANRCQDFSPWGYGLPRTVLLSPPL